MIRVRVEGTNEICWITPCAPPIGGLTPEDSEERRDKVTAETLIERDPDPDFKQDPEYPNGLIAKDAETARDWKEFIAGANAFFETLQRYRDRYGADAVNAVTAIALEGADVYDPRTYWIDRASDLVRVFGLLDMPE